MHVARQLSVSMMLSSSILLRSRPLASLTSVLLSSVAGSLLTNLMLGLPVAAAFKSETFLLMIIAAWAGVFYCPQVSLTNIHGFIDC